MSEHTPGPWTAVHEPATTHGDWVDNGGYRIDAGRVSQLAFVWALNHRVLGNGVPQENGDLFGAVQAGANARLIAAAPDMLSALQELEEFLDNQADADDGRPNDAMRHLTEVRAAIAKAEGKTP